MTSTWLPSQPKQTRNNLSAQGKLAVLLFLYDHCVARDLLAKGAIQKAAAKFQVSRNVVGDIWKLRKEIKKEDVKSVVLQSSRRSETVHSLAHQLGVPKSTVQDHLKKGWLQSFSNFKHSETYDYW